MAVAARTAPSRRAPRWTPRPVAPGPSRIGWRAAALLVVALVAGLGARGLALEDKRILTYDESISYLAASCRQGDYGRLDRDARPPVGTWVRASEWQRFLEPQRALCLPTIGSDLATWDIHPPAYFWLLHLWTLAFWAGPAVGSLLNLVLFASGVVALFGLARRVLGAPVPAAFVALVWATSPIVVPVVTEARQYDLFALLAILFAWQVLRVIEAPTRGRGAVLALVTATGALTHFHFALLAGGAVVAVAPAALRGVRRMPLAVSGSLATGYAASIALHPRFLESFERQRAQVGRPPLADVPARLELTATTLSHAVLPPWWAPRGVGFAVAALVVAGVLAVVLSPRLRRPRMAAARTVLVLLACVFGGIATTFVVGMSHPYAMSGKHLAPVWPLLAFVPVLLVLGLAPGARRAVAAVGSAALVAAAIAAGVRAFPDVDVRPVEAAERGVDAVVVDTTHRGELPAIVMRLAPDVPVLAADGATLRARRAAWEPRLGDRALLVGSPSPDPEVPAQRAALLRELAATHRAKTVARPWYGAIAGEYVVLTRAGPRGGS